MNITAKVALATAAVVLAALLGYNYLVAPNVGGPRLFAPDPTPTLADSSRQRSISRNTRAREERCSRGPT